MISYRMRCMQYEIVYNMLYIWLTESTQKLHSIHLLCGLCEKIECSGALMVGHRLWVSVKSSVWMGIHISMVNQVSYSSARYFIYSEWAFRYPYWIQCLILSVGIHISILNPVPDCSAQYLIQIVSEHSYLHTEFSAQFQCSILSVSNHISIVPNSSAQYLM